MVGTGARMAVQQGVLHAGQGGAQFAHHLAAVVVAAGIGHAVAGNQHLGRDLRKAVQNGSGTHVGRTNAPDAANAGYRQERHHGLGDVGQVRGNAVARLHALGLQMQRQRGDLPAQFGPTEFAVVAAFVAADEGGLPRLVCRINMPEHLLHIVGLRPRKPQRARHGVARQRGAVGRW